MFGFYRVAAAVPALALADPAENARRCAELTAQAHQNGAALVVFPECALTGYTCADLFDSSTLQDAAVDGLHAYCAATSTYDIITAIGLPLLANGRLYNCAVVTRRGEKSWAWSPKSFLPVYREFYEPRWFESGADIRNRTIRIGKIADVPFGVDLLFETDDWSLRHRALRRPLERDPAEQRPGARGCDRALESLGQPRTGRQVRVPAPACDGPERALHRGLRLRLQRSRGNPPPTSSSEAMP